MSKFRRTVYRPRKNYGNGEGEAGCLTSPPGTPRRRRAKRPGQTPAQGARDVQVHLHTFQGTGGMSKTVEFRLPWVVVETPLGLCELIDNAGNLIANNFDKDMAMAVMTAVEHEIKDNISNI